MSRSTRGVLPIPSGVDVSIIGQTVKIKGVKGALEYVLHSIVEIKKEEQVLKLVPRNFAGAVAIAGTMRALLRNMFDGVNKGYEKKLVLVGVGYRAQVQGAVLNLQIGFSHPIRFTIPDGIKIDTPSQTEVIVRGIDRQLVSQVAALVRAYRPPEPYKGKGIRYADEIIIQKEGKKK